MAIPLYRLLESGQTVWYSVITAAIYLIMMYSVAWRIGYADSRKIPGYFPDRRLPRLISGFVSIIPAALLIFRLVWSKPVPDSWFLSNVINGDHSFLLSNNYISGLADFIYKLWYIPFAAFLTGNSILVFLLLLLVLPAVICIGYETGIRRFQILDKVYGLLLFQNKDKKK